VKELYGSSRIYCQLCGMSHDPEGIPRAPAPERSMKATFYLIDLVSQCAAVERRLAGMSEAQKIDWLADSGPSRTVIPTDRGQRSGDCGQFPMSV